MTKKRTNATDAGSVLQSIKEFIETYPDLKSFPRVDMEKLEEDATAYMIENVPAEPFVKKYLDGSSVRQTVFAISSREFYGDVENLETHAFYERFAAWMEECTRNNTLPDLGSNREPMSIKATTGAYVYDAEGTKAQYRIQCVLKYYQKQ